MKNQIAFVAALWCMLVSPVAAEKTAAETDFHPSRQVASQGRCEVEPTEAQQIAKFSDRISRRGDELIIRLKDGTEVSRKNSPDIGQGYVDCDDKVNVGYTFVDFIEPWFLIREGYDEGGATLCINWETGSEKSVDVVSEFSPDRTRFITMGDPYGGPCNAEIWKLSRTGIFRERLVEHGCNYSFHWSDSTAVEVAGSEHEVIAHLNYDGSSWKCSGSPEICGSPNASCESKKMGVIRFFRHRPGTRATGEVGPDLRSAARAGDLEAAKRLLDSGADVNGEGPNGQTPLTLAAWGGHAEVVKMLLDRGADPNARDRNCATALGGPCFGSLQRNQEVTKLLVSKGADVNARDKRGSTAWIGAAVNDFAMTKFLVDHGADVNATDDSGDTALMRAAMNGKLDVVQFLLDAGAQVNVHGAHGLTAFMKAAEENHLEVMKVLLSRGAEIDARDEDEGTALMMAASAGNRAVIDLLLSTGADIDTSDKEGCTALMRAASAGRQEAIDLLLPKGADINAKDQNGWTALMWAAEKPHQKVFDLLRDRGAKMTLPSAVWLADLEEARRLIQEGADVNTRGGSYRRTALMYAVASERVEVVKLLLDNGADANARDYNCGTALEIAKEGNYKEIERLLRARGATR